MLKNIVTEPGVYVVDSAVSNVGLDLINCLRDEEGKIVTKMRKDGYLHATSMCDSFGKLWAHLVDWIEPHCLCKLCLLEQAYQSTPLT